MSGTEPTPQNSSSTGIDKEALYGFNREGERRKQRRVDWQDRLHQKAAYMSLDIPEDEEVGDIHVDKSTRIREQHVHNHAAPPKSKLGWLAKTAVAAGLIASGAGITAGIPLVIDLLKPSPAAPVVVPSGDPDSDTSLELNFWDK